MFQTFYDPIQEVVIFVADDGIALIVPALQGYIEDGNAVVKCPYCGKLHRHGPREGTYVAHCSGGKDYYIWLTEKRGKPLWRGVCGPDMSEA